MDHRYDLDLVAPSTPTMQEAESPLKYWRLKYQAGTIQKNDIINFFQMEARKYFHFQYDKEGDQSKPALKCIFKEAAVKENIIDVLAEFMLGDNPKTVLEKFKLEGTTAAVCGKVFKSGEPTYSCRECGMDPTCVLCVNCFKQSAHRYHKYKMSTSGGGGCCDCGDEEAWKKDHYCEEHLRGKENPTNSTIITDAIKERCEIAFVAILSFCVSFLEIEPNASLKCLDGDGDDYFCTVLYNDESHTFDQVIQTLTKIAKCGQRNAMEIVSSIDREGRAVVRCDTFEKCIQLKEAIEKQSVTVNSSLNTSRANQSLRVSVLHIHSVACQQLALQLLAWFQEFLVRHVTFRQIFARAIMDKKAPYYIRHILEYDVKLWKTARTCWHRLLISGMLMEYDNKMALAVQFSQCYATVVQAFISDDHEHTFSIVSLSVQLFTVPSISHYLIANESIFNKLLHTFYHGTIQEFVKNDTLHFAKSMSNMTHLKRAAYILYDLRYILSFKPDVWTDDLRSGFLEGCKALLRLLNVMQGMESVTRQTDQHVDYEPEWESAFNLHIKLASTISLVLEWCASDREVLLKFYKMVMRYMQNNSFILSAATMSEVSVAGHIANCLIYDVAAKPVSIHLPLSRLFAGLYLHLGTYDLTFDNISSVEQRTPEQLMEPMLCTQTMIAQVNAGMWRRNGYSLLHQLYFYRNVRCRAEMLDRDIVGMQIGAALIESNQYLIHLLNKFNLIRWMQPHYEDHFSVLSTDDDFNRQLSMIDEFLELLIVIIGERYMPGISLVTEEDRIKKEIIQLLCIKSYSHSELNRALSDSNNDTVLEDVIDSVAVFKKPQKSDAKGVYELKDELYNDYNMYFYHYTKEEKSKSEETQRLRRKNKGELLCCPPPKLPKLTTGFVSIANLLQCDVMLEIISTVLNRALDLKAKSFTENHLQKVLHLIGYGLQEEQSEHYPFLSFYERSQKHKIISKLEELLRSSRGEAHRDFIVWTLNKFKELQAKEAAASGEAMQSEDASSSGTRSGTNDAPLSAAEKEKQEKEKRAQLAAESRAKIMAQMKNAQKNFMKSNAEMFAGSNEVAVPSETMEWQDENENEGGAKAYDTVACLGVDRRLQQPEEQSFKCILCFADCTVTKDGPTLVYSAFIQKSTVLPPPHGKETSVYTSSCGHVMHDACWKEYYQNEESKEQRRQHRSRSLMQHTDFQCPYCRCLSNTVLPLTAPLSKFSPPNVVHAGDELFPMDLWIEVLKTLSTELNKTFPDSQLIFGGADKLEDIRSTTTPHDDGDDDNDDDDNLNGVKVKEPVEITWESILQKAYIYVDIEQFKRIAQPIAKPTLPESWLQFVQNYQGSVMQQINSKNDLANRVNNVQLMWQSSIYTVRALEMYLRAIDKPFNNELSIRHKSCLSGLIRLMCLHVASMSPGDMKELQAPTAKFLDMLFKHKGTSVLEWNCFDMMVKALMLVPTTLFAATPDVAVVINGSMMDYYTLQLFFLANIVKAIVQYEAPADVINPNTEQSMDVDDDVDDYSDEHVQNLPNVLQQSIMKFYCKYNLAARRTIFTQQQQQQQEQNISTPTEEVEQEQQQLQQQQESENESIQDETTTETTTTPNPKLIFSLFAHIRTEMREFLRCSCLFFHFVTDVEFPAEFNSTGSDTYDNMCKYLGLHSNLEIYFDDQSYYAPILENFGSHPDIANYNFATNKRANGEDFHFVRCIQPAPQLVDLPEDYSDLINSVSDIICPNNEREDMKSPTMCLVCGEILCGHSFCCQPELDSRPVGACTYHAYYCSAEIGLFLRIRDCQIVYLGRNKGCFVLPPYLDEYGETDQGLRRGNPLRLCPARYRKIHLSWLEHGLHEEIARANDNNTVALTQWQHM